MLTAAALGFEMWQFLGGSAPEPPLPHRHPAGRHRRRPPHGPQPVTSVIRSPPVPQGYFCGRGAEGLWEEATEADPSGFLTLTPGCGHTFGFFSLLSSAHIPLFYAHYHLTGSPCAD